MACSASDYYELFPRGEISASATWTLNIPVDNNPECNADVLAPRALNQIIDPADCSGTGSPTCWDEAANVTTSGQTLQISGLSSSSLTWGTFAAAVTPNLTPTPTPTYTPDSGSCASHLPALPIPPDPDSVHAPQILRSPRNTGSVLRPHPRIRPGRTLTHTNRHRESLILFRHLSALDNVTSEQEIYRHRTNFPCISKGRLTSSNHRRQANQLKKTNKGKISNRPASIPTIKINFAATGMAITSATEIKLGPKTPMAEKTVE